MSRTVQIVVFVWLALVSVALAYLLWRQTTAETPRPPAPQTTASFEQLDVQRLNIVEPDGKPRVIVSSAKRYPGIIWAGKEYPHPGRAAGGILFFNDDGTEAGGITYSNDAKAKEAGAIITIDQHDQDQTLALMYEEADGKRAAGLSVWDRPDKPLLPVIIAARDIADAKTDADRAKAGQRVEAIAKEMGEPAPRLFAGKRLDDSIVELYDKHGTPRLRMKVDGTGAPSIELLDADGKAIARLPAK